MKTRNPIWVLPKKRGYCTYCEDECGLVYLKCKECGSVLLECERGHSFKAKLPVSSELEIEYTCPYCGENTENTNSFAQAEEIIAAGFDRDDYE